MISTHPTDARYYDSRRAAMEARQPGEHVIRLGSFARGSFGCYGRLTSSGQPYGGPYSGIIVWMLTAMKEAKRY